MKRGALSCARRYAHAEVAGEAHKAQLSNTIGYYFSAQARRLGHRDGFRVPHQGVMWSYIDMKKNSDAFAQGLFNSGLQAGSRVLSIQPSTAEAFMTHAACARLGVVCVHFNPYEATPQALEDALDKYQPTHVVIRESCELPDKKGPVTRSLYEMLYQSIPELDQVVGNATLRSNKYPSVREVIVTDNNMNLPGATTLRSKLQWGPFNYYESTTRRIAMFLTPDQPVSIVPGTGKDGKDYVYTHRHVMTAAYHMAQFLGLKNDTRLMLAPQATHRPLFLLAHYASLAAGSTIAYGAEHLFHDNHVGPFLENLEQEQSEGLLLEKEQVDLLLGTVAGQGVGKHLKWVGIGSEEPLDEAYLSRVRDTFVVEAVHNVCGPMEALSALTLRTAGKGAKLVPNSAARVVGDEGGEQAKTLGRGVTGALRLKGPSVSPLYWNFTGMMEYEKDVMGYYDIGRDAVVTKDGELQVSSA